MMNSAPTSRGRHLCGNGVVDWLHRDEGLEFETADRFADEISAIGFAAWLDRLENDPHEWAFRFDLARVEIEALLPYVRNSAS
jgi:hypothetical protein